MAIAGNLAYSSNTNSMYINNTVYLLKTMLSTDDSNIMIPMYAFQTETTQQTYV